MPSIRDWASRARVCLGNRFPALGDVGIGRVYFGWLSEKFRSPFGLLSVCRASLASAASDKSVRVSRRQPEERRAMRNSSEVHETAMPLGGRNAAWLPILSLVWGFASTAIGQARNSAGSPVSSPAASSDTPPTERERMLLERIERLEQRLSEIEASGATAPAARAAAPPASQVSAASAPAPASPSALPS